MFPSSRAAWARLFVVAAVAFLVITSVAALILWLTIPARPVPINVRWRPEVTPAERAALEQRFGLIDGRATEGTTWAYTLADPSSATIRAIVQHERVDDTAHVNRRRFRPAFAYDRTRRVALFSAAIGAAGAALVAARPMLSALGTPVALTPAALTGVVAAPALLVGAGSALILAMALVGLRPLWGQDAAVTLAQAAASADHVMVAKLIAAGSNPDDPTPVQLEERVAVLTPLEAAVLSRDLETFELLVKLGARVDADNRARLACLAREVGADEIAESLKGEGQSPADADLCSGVSLPVH